MNTIDTKRGFTLIEILLVVAIIAILAGIVILAIDPNQQATNPNNARQQADVQTILDAVYLYAVDNEGDIPDDPGEITTNRTEICTTNSCDGLVDLSDLITDGQYLASIPVDPEYNAGAGGNNPNSAGYNIVKTLDNRVTVASWDGNVIATR
jgi:type IV pilus assembly protein PilA